MQILRGGLQQNIGQGAGSDAVQKAIIRFLQFALFPQIFHATRAGAEHTLLICTAVAASGCELYMD